MKVQLPLSFGALVLLLKVVVVFAPRCGKRMTVLLACRLPRVKRNIISSMFHQFVIACLACKTGGWVTSDDDVLWWWLVVVGQRQ